MSQKETEFKVDVEAIVKGKMGDKYKYLPRFVVNWLKKILHQDEVNAYLTGRASGKYGRLFPLGWWHILRALFWKYPETLDLLLIAVTKEYRNKGITAIMLGELIPNYIKMGFKWGETTLELESNSNIQAMWEMYDHRIHKRHSLFTKKL